MNVELVKNFRIIATGFYSYGGGRYIASTAGPDVIVRPNGTLSGIRSGSGIGGFEWQPNPKTVIYGYYSGAYFGKNFDGVTNTADHLLLLHSPDMDSLDRVTRRTGTSMSPHSVFTI